VRRMLTRARRDRGYLLRRRVRQLFTWRGVFRSYLAPLLESA
jgi:hypothetical protein